MPDKSGTYERLDRQWQSACRLLLGREIGELSRYEDWLCEGLEPFEKRKSRISGKEVYAVGKYPKDARFISFDEIDYARKFEPLSINEMKDIDSIAQALGERASYCGNVVLGNSSNVEESAGVENSHFIMRAHTCHNCQDVAYSTLFRECKTLFGTNMAGESGFCIKGRNVWRTFRCLEGWKVLQSSDIWYSHALDGCVDCLFCFNLKGQNNCIGNVKLERSKYLSLKNKLIWEIAGELEKKKKLPSLAEIFSMGKPNLEGGQAESPPSDTIARLDDDFGRTCKIILGKRIASLAGLSDYLSDYIRKVIPYKSTVSSFAVYGCEGGIESAVAKTGRMVRLKEHDSVSSIRDWPENCSQKSLSFRGIREFAQKIAYFTYEQDHQAKNAIECAGAYESVDCIRCSHAYSAKNCAYSFWPRNSEFEFGCDATRNSSFCLHCYNSYRLSRCFEVDTSQDCTGCYFCHNCENVHDSMFCFNVKNLRYAIGNAEVGKETFEKVKKMLLAEINSIIWKEGGYNRSIYNISGKRRENA